MTTRNPTTAPRHFRSTPGTDVALCGERGSKLLFVMGQRQVTCETCREKRASPVAFRRAQREFSARARREKLNRLETA